MKQFITFAIATALFSQAAFAQICAFQVDGNKISYKGEEISIKDVEVILEKDPTDYQDIFVYVTYDTPIGLANDLRAIITGSCTAGVDFLNPERSGDFPRPYGPKIVYLGNFLEFDMLKEARTTTFSNTNENPGEYILQDASPDDYAYNTTRIQMHLRTPHDMPDAVTEWTNNFDCVVFNLAYQTPIGQIFCLDYDMNSPGVPAINVVYHTEETPLCPERWFRFIDTGLEEFEFRTVPVGQEGVEALYNGKDLKTFVDTYRAYASISQLNGKEARPGKGRAVVQFEITPLGTVQNVEIVRASNLRGLDEVILSQIQNLKLWAPQFVNGEPVTVKVSCPITGEISQW